MRGRGLLSSLTLRVGVALLCAAPWSSSPVRAQGLLRLDFEGPEPTWQSAGGDMEFRIDGQQRVAGAAQNGDWCEQVRLIAGNGSYVYLSHDIGAARAIQELRASVWVKSDRAGLQILARLVLPRTLDQRTGKPVTTLLRGASYNKPGDWQQLRLVDLPRLVEREAVLLRTRLGPNVDTHEAFLDAVYLNIYGGPGATQVWIDDLEIEGFVGRRPGKSPEMNNIGWTNAGAKGVAELAKKQTVALNGSLLLVYGRPYFPRLIEYQGEPLKLLKDLGFNGVRLAAFPRPSILAEAEQEGMWIVCPPPRAAGDASSAIAIPDLPGRDRILAWNLGQNLAGRDVEATRNLAESLRSVDRDQARPLTAEVDDDLRSFGRHVDVLRASRYPLLTSLELADYGQWLRDRPRLARPGTTLWTSIQTQSSLALIEQSRAFTPDARTTPNISSEQLRMLAFVAISQGVKGLCFESRTRLDASDPVTRQRAMTLELLNLELDLIEPWCAAGSVVTSIIGSDPETRATLMQTDRARLLIPVWAGRHSQFVPGQSAGNNITFTIPGVPETSDAYEIHPTGMRTLRHKQRRVTGGVRITLDEFGPTSLVLLTQDPLVVNSANKKLEHTAERAARLQRDLAAARLADAIAIDRQLTNVAPAVQEAPGWLASARDLSTQADAMLAAKNAAQAYVLSQRSMRAVRALERAHWDKAVASVGSPMAAADLTSFATLPQFWTSMARLRGLERGLNQLAGGDFEDLDRLLQVGWRHFQHPQPEIESEAQLAIDAPHAGKSCLQLRAWRVGNEPASGLVETPPIWINSSPIDVTAGTIVRIHGWVHLPAPIGGSVDGLMIIDSLTGPALAARVAQTNGWQEFTLYRAAPQDSPLVVTFALTGLGAARLDDITIEAYSERNAPPSQSQAGYRIQRLPAVPK